MPLADRPLPKHQALHLRIRIRVYISVHMSFSVHMSLSVQSPFSILADAGRDMNLPETLPILTRICGVFVTLEVCDKKICLKCGRFIS
jgi:hypothetical protein